MEHPTPPRLLAFVRSRIPMVEHDFAGFPGKSSSHAKQRREIATYSSAQAFFYAADLWVDKPPSVSTKALAYAIERWGDQAHKIWTLKRAEIPRMDRCRIGQSGLMYEHVTTGGMFRRFIEKMLNERSGVLDPFAVACWIDRNFQTAWVTRDEDKLLTNVGYKSRRGETLEEAQEAYKKCGIVLSPRPTQLPTEVLVGDSELEDELNDGDVSNDSAYTQPILEGRTVPAGHYRQFFEEVAQALERSKSILSLAIQDNRHYAVLRGLGVASTGAVLLLNAPRGALIRTPVLSLEAETTKPAEEPPTAAWTQLRDSIFGPDWHISYGRLNKMPNALCRSQRALTHAFDVADASARREAAQRTAAELVAQREALQT